jgi:hypothetical protein
MEYKKWLREFTDEKNDFGHGPGKKEQQTQDFLRWHTERVKGSKDGYTSHRDVYNDYLTHVKKHSKQEPLPKRADNGHDFDLHMRRMEHMPTPEHWPVTIQDNN